MQGNLPFYPEARISDDVLLYYQEASFHTNSIY